MAAFKTVDDYAAEDQKAQALGMLIHHVLAICEEYSAVIRYGNGNPKTGNARKYWLEVNANLKGRYEGGKTVTRFKAHTEAEAIEKAIAVLHRGLIDDTQ